MEIKNPAETSEFYVPTLGLTVDPYIKVEKKQGIHHVGRYEWACEVLKQRRPRRVIDIACGAGFGSFMLATSLPEATIVGADYDQKAIDHARANYKAGNLSFVGADIASWSTESGPLGSFDAVVSFDTIEHVLHREIAFMRICDALPETGAFLLSTPCGRRTYNNLLPGWEHHKIEYGYPDLYNMLARFFRQIVTPGHPDYPAWDIWENKINAGKMRYYNRLNPVVCEQPIHISLPEYAILPEPADSVAPRGGTPPQ